MSLGTKLGIFLAIVVLSACGRKASNFSEVNAAADVKSVLREGKYEWYRGNVSRDAYVAANGDIFFDTLPPQSLATVGAHCDGAGCKMFPMVAPAIKSVLPKSSTTFVVERWQMLGEGYADTWDTLTFEFGEHEALATSSSSNSHARGLYCAERWRACMMHETVPFSCGSEYRDCMGPDLSVGQ